MGTACSRRNEWHYNWTYGLAGLIAAAIVLILMRHDPAHGLAFAVAITSGAGWTRRRTPTGGDGPSAGRA